jgi:hypothetical protein
MIADVVAQLERTVKTASYQGFRGIGGSTHQNFDALFGE